MSKDKRNAYGVQNMAYQRDEEPAPPKTHAPVKRDSRLSQRDRQETANFYKKVQTKTVKELQTELQLLTARGQDKEWLQQRHLASGERTPLLLHAITHAKLDVVRYLAAELKLDLGVTDRVGAGALHYAAKKRKNKETKALLEFLMNRSPGGAAAGSSRASSIPNTASRAADNSQRSPLHLAAISGNSTAAQCLLEEKQATKDRIAMFTARDANDKTPFHEAVSNEQTEMVGMALRLIQELPGRSSGQGSAGGHPRSGGGNPEPLIRGLDGTGRTALHLAVRSNNLGMVQLLLQSVKDKRELIETEDKCGGTALSDAISKKAPDIVKELIDNGADPAKRLRGGRENALHVACTAGDVGVVDLLLGTPACSSVLHDQDYRGDTPLQRAVRHKHMDIMHKLTQLCGHDDPVEADAVQVEFTNRTASLPARPPSSPIEKYNMERLTPLLTACSYGEPASLQHLIARGAHTDRKDKYGRTAIALSCQHGRPDNLQVLLAELERRGTLRQAINAAADDGSTPLHVCAKNGATDCAKLLLKHPTLNKDRKNAEADTPFLVAVKQGDQQMAGMLMDATDAFCIQDVDDEGRTALHLVASEGNKDIIGDLLGRGATTNCRDKQKRTPLDAACEADQLQIVNQLLEHMVHDDDNDNQDDWLSDTLYRACKMGKERSVKALLEKGADVVQYKFPENSNEKNMGNTKRTGKGTDGQDKGQEYNALNIAIENGHTKTARAIVASEQWQEALMSGQPAQPFDTPFRKLIRTMPEVAEEALDKCTRVEKHKEKTYSVEFDFLFIDDTYIKFDQDNTEQIIEEKYENRKPGPENPESEQENAGSGYIKSGTSRYADTYYVQENHPLSLMVQHKREKLLRHPLVLSLISRKWKKARIIYGFFFIYYLLYLLLLSWLVVREDPSLKGNMTCEPPTSIVDYRDIFPPLLIIMAVAGIILEVLQLLITRRKYLHSYTNALDWFSYISTLLVMWPSGCDWATYTTSWQWQLSAFCLFFSWINFIIFLERFPVIGIYIVMITQIFFTFFRFLTVFLLFIVAFGLSFYILLQNQDPFRDPWHSLTKTWVMTLGEMDYGDIFTPEEEDDETPYKASVRAIFLIFLVLLAVIVNNLLTGLAVEDVNKLQEDAKLKRTALQITMALDVELALPPWRCLSRFRLLRPAVVRRKRYEFPGPLAKPEWLQPVKRLWARVFPSSLSSSHFLQVATSGKDEPMDRTRREQQVDRDRDLERRLDRLETRLISMETMLREREGGDLLRRGIRLPAMQMLGLGMAQGQGGVGAGK